MELGIYIFLIGVSIYCLGKLSKGKYKSIDKSRNVFETCLNYINDSYEFKKININYGKIFMIVSLLYFLFYKSAVILLIVILIIVSTFMYLYTNISTLFKIIKNNKIR